MRYIAFFTLVLVILGITGCSNKQYYKPNETHTLHSNAYGGTIVDISRNGATLKNEKYIGKHGVSKIEIGKGYRFLNENEKYALASNAEGILNIIDKRTNKSMRAVSLHIPIVSATIHDDLVAYILNNNTFGIYQISDNRKVVENRSERTYAIDTKAASPMFIDNLAIMPMLDGKLIIVDTANTDNAKVVYISSYKAFNNVTYLSRMGDTMVASTPKRLMTLGDFGKKEYSANISEVVVDKKYIYLFTKEGEVLKFNDTLEKLAKNKFKFAHFSAATALNGKIYALDHQGSLIVLSSDLSKFKVYDFGSVKKAAFATGLKLYKDGKVIDLSKLGYE